MYQHYDETLNKWLNGKPTEIGQLYRYTDAAGGVIETYWAGDE